MLMGILLWIGSSITKLSMGALIGLLVFLIARDDMVGAIVGKRLKAENPSPDDLKIIWKKFADSLTGFHVPPDVWLQVLVNRILQFRTERLQPVKKRLEAVMERLSVVIRKSNRARTAYKFERSLLMAAVKRLENKRQVTSTAMNTESREKAKKSTEKETSQIVEELAQLISGTVVSETIATQPKPGSKSEISSDSATKPASGSKSTIISDTPPMQPESLNDNLIEIAVNLATRVLWLKSFLTSGKTTEIAAKMYHILHAVNKSPLLRYVKIESIIKMTDKLIKLTTDVNVANGTTEVSLNLFPEMSNTGKFILDL